MYYFLYVFLKDPQNIFCSGKFAFFSSSTKAKKARIYLLEQQSLGRGKIIKFSGEMPSFFRVSCLLDFQIVVFSFAGKVKGRNIEVKLSIFGLLFLLLFSR